MRAVGTWRSGYETLLEDTRGHAVTTDLEREEGGLDAGTSALELCGLSLAGCITTIFALVAKKRRLRIDAMTIELEIDRPDRSPTIASVEGILRVTSPAPLEEVTTVLRITLRTCPVGVLFEKAGIPVRVQPVVSSPPL